MEVQSATCQINYNTSSGNCILHENNSKTRKKEYDDWRINETGAFSFLQCSVTSAVQVDGTKSITDTVLNSKVVNIRKSSPKALDLDIYDHIYDHLTTVHSMNIAIVGNNGDVAFKGKIAQFLITKDMWLNSVCLDMTEGNHTKIYLSAKLTSVIMNVEWYQHLDSPTLTALKSISADNGGKLSMPLTLCFPPKVPSRCVQTFQASICSRCHWGHTKMNPHYWLEAGCYPVKV